MTKEPQKSKMITFRASQREVELLEDLVRRLEKDRSATIKYAIRYLWYNEYIVKNGTPEYVV